MELSPEILQKLTGVAAALIGGIVTGVFSMHATKAAIRRENDKERRREDKEINNLLDALGVELGTLWGFHMSRIGKIVEELPEGAALEFYYPLTQDYFTVYNSSAAMIGRVKNHELRQSIVVCYNKCKKVVDGFKYNNELYRDWRDMADYSHYTNSPRLEAKRVALIEYAQVIREDHYELKGYVEELLAMLPNATGR